MQSRVIETPDKSQFAAYSIPSDLDPHLPLFVLHHGGGHCAAVWTLCARKLASLVPKSSILAYDCRGHGRTQTVEESDLSLDRLSQDLVSLVHAAYGESGLPSQIILVGHSLGGAVVVDVAKRRLLPKVIGVCVLDVVEGTAMDSLSHMSAFLMSRPSRFKTTEEAIEWSLRTNAVKNAESARISIPPQLKLLRDNDPSGGYIWRTNLAASKEFWKGWFQDLSTKFLSCACARMLMLASTDRLDKELIVGQMQGKFQLVLFNETGHNIHEDSSDKVSSALAEFLVRNQPLEIKRFPIPNNPKSHATSPTTPKDTL
ncbi:MAG: hypothetical protein SGCHY_004464 [Lobulomycetales sp.]